MHPKFKERIEKVKREREENPQEVKYEPTVIEVFDACPTVEQAAIVRLLAAMLHEDKSLSYHPTIQSLLKHIVNKAPV